MTTTIKTTTSARPARRRRSRHRERSNRYTRTTFSVEPRDQSARTATLRFATYIEYDAHTPPSVRTPRRSTSHHRHPHQRIFAPRTYPTIESIRVADVAYLGRARLLDARAGGVGGLGGNHGVGLGNHRRRVTSIGVRVCRRWTMGDAGVDDGCGARGVTPPGFASPRASAMDGWMDPDPTDS